MLKGLTIQEFRGGEIILGAVTLKLVWKTPFLEYEIYPGPVSQFLMRGPALAYDILRGAIVNRTKYC